MTKELSISQTLSFFRSVILSGESWSSTCEAAFDSAQSRLTGIAQAPALPGLVTTLRSYADDCEDMSRWATPELAPLLRRAADVIEAGVSPVSSTIQKAPANCPHCIDETDCASVDICNAVAEVSAPSSTDGECAKCGCEMKGEAALVGNEVWCHPCADGVVSPAYSEGGT